MSVSGPWKRWRRVVLAFIALAGFPAFPTAPHAQARPIDRVTEIRSRLLDADRSAPDVVGRDRLSDGAKTRLAQYWRNWPNYWANWPNWGNWGNWPNWRNW